MLLVGLGVGIAEGVTDRDATAGAAVVERRTACGSGGKPEEPRREPGVSGESVEDDFRVLVMGSGGSGMVGGLTGGG